VVRKSAGLALLLSHIGLRDPIRELMNSYLDVKMRVAGVWQARRIPSAGPATLHPLSAPEEWHGSFWLT
jgi:hypothetical protein